MSKVDSKVSTETDEISIPDVSDLVNKCIVKNMQKGINGVEVTQNGTRDNQNILKEYVFSMNLVSSVRQNFLLMKMYFRIC